MALPKTESFTDTTGTDLDVHDASWVQQAPASGKLRISGNACLSTADDWCSARWTGDTFSNDQYAKAKLLSVANYSGVQVRMTGSNGTLSGYVLWMFGGSLYLYRHDNSAAPNASIQDAIVAPSVNDIIEIRASGTTISAWLNGSQIGTNHTDATYASGSAGLMVNSSVVALLDDWEGGNIGGAAGASDLSVNAYEPVIGSSLF